MTDAITARLTYAKHRLVARGKPPFCVLDVTESGPSSGECMVTDRTFANAITFEDGIRAIFPSESVARNIAEQLNGGAS